MIFQAPPVVFSLLLLNKEMVFILEIRYIPFGKNGNELQGKTKEIIPFVLKDQLSKSKDLILNSLRDKKN